MHIKTLNVYHINFNDVPMQALFQDVHNLNIQLNSYNSLQPQCGHFI